MDKNSATYGVWLWYGAIDRDITVLNSFDWNVTVLHFFNLFTKLQQKYSKDSIKKKKKDFFRIFSKKFHVVKWFIEMFSIVVETNIQFTVRFVATGKIFKNRVENIFRNGFFENLKSANK